MVTKNVTRVKTPTKAASARTAVTPKREEERQAIEKIADAFRQTYEPALKELEKH